MARLRIVVGVDGSAGSREVVERAVVFARALDADLHVVLAYEPAVPTPRAYGLEPVPSARTLMLAEERLAAVLSSLEAGDRIRVTAHRVVRGHPQQVLVREATGAELLVVGSRGTHSAVQGLLLGSVADHCVRHAPCPVLVVRPHQRRDDETTINLTGLTTGEAPAR